MTLKIYIFLLISAFTGFGLSTGAASINGYFPCVIYGVCAPVEVKEIERLSKEIKILSSELKKIKKEQLKEVRGLQARLNKEKKYNNIFTKGVKEISDINSNGESNEEKIRRTADAITTIGNSILSLR